MNMAKWLHPRLRPSDLNPVITLSVVIQTLINLLKINNIQQRLVNKEYTEGGCRHSSVPSCCPGFESQAHHLCIFSFIVFVLYLSYEKNENKQKEARFGSFFKESTVTMSKVIATDSDVFYGTVSCVITSFIELVPGCYLS